MKKLCLFMFGLGVACVCGASASDLRDSINFNRGWRFQLGDVTNASAARFDDSKWDDANLPHSFSMPYFAADRFYVGYGCLDGAHRGCGIIRHREPRARGGALAGSHD